MNYLQYKVNFINSDDTFKSKIKLKSSEFLKDIELFNSKTIPLKLKNKFISVNNILLSKIDSK